MTEPDILADLERDGLRKALNKALRDLARAKAKTEELVEAVYQATADAIVANPIRPVPAPAKERIKGKPEVALWHLTDWQGGKTSLTYNSEVMHQRVRRFIDKADRITAIERSDHPVNDCVILFGGDMVEGLFQFATQPFEVDATDQYGS